MAPAPARLATSSQASRVTVSGFTPSATTRSARKQVLFCPRVSDAIAAVVDPPHQSRIEQPLLDRIDAKVDRAQLTSQLASAFRYSNPREPCEDDQHENTSAMSYLSVLGMACGLGMPGGIAV